MRVIFVLFILLLSNLGQSEEFATRWNQATEPDDYFAQPPLHRMKPLVYGDTVIAGNGLDNISSYEAVSGKRVWRLSVAGGVEGGAALDGKTLYFGGNDGDFYAVNADTGSVKWKVNIGAEVLAAPVIVGDKIYFMGGNNIVHALKKTDGSKLWAFHRQQQTYFSVRAAATPLVSGSSVYVGTSDGFFVSLNAANGNLIWERQLNTNKKFKDVDATPILDGDKIFVSSFDGALYCLEISSGKIIWKYEEGGYLPPLIQGETLFYSTTTRKFVALNKLNGKEIWKIDNLNGIPTGSGFLKDKIFFAESAGDLKLVTAKNGSLVASFRPGRGVIATPSYDEKSNLIFLMSNGGNLIALRLERSTF